MESQRSTTERICIIEGVNNCTLFYDTRDQTLPWLESALGFIAEQSMAPGSIVAILGDIAKGDTDEDPYPSMARLLQSSNVGRIIGIGKQIKQLSPLFGKNAVFYESADEFLSSASADDFKKEPVLIKGPKDGDFEKVKSFLQERKTQTRLEVSLDAIAHNYNFFRSKLDPDTKIMCMVKASGYGAGAVGLARTLQQLGAAYLAVAILDEGIELRKAGVMMPIVVLNPMTRDYRAMFSYKLEPEVYSFDLLREMIFQAKENNISDFPIHIKLDTGMHRLGFLEKDIPELIATLAGQHFLKPVSVFSHLATADCLDMDEYTLMQLKRFESWSGALQQGFGHKISRHILNSTGILRFTQCQHEMVRLGICLYGMPTIPEGMEELRPVSTLRTAVISIKEWEASDTIGYSRRGVLRRHSRIATIPIGYADGIDRHLGNGHTEVFINAHRCPTVGNICMDLCMIDVTGIECQVGDEVEIFGDNIPVVEIADKLGTISYEVLTSVAPRVKRVYCKS